eukprot:6010280-Heterocapsa_arctica.AAC.1
MMPNRMGKHRFMVAKGRAHTREAYACSPKLAIVEWRPLGNRRQWLSKCDLILSLREPKGGELGWPNLGTPKRKTFT